MLHVRPLFILATLCVLHKHALLLNQHNGVDAPQSNNTNSVPSSIYHNLLLETLYIYTLSLVTNCGIRC